MIVISLDDDEAKDFLKAVDEERIHSHDLIIRDIYTQIEIELSEQAKDVKRERKTQ